MNTSTAREFETRIESDTLHPAPVARMSTSDTLRELARHNPTSYYLAFARSNDED